MFDIIYGKGEVNNMRSGDVVVIIYQDKGGQFSKRNVRIVTIGKTFIVAYCYYRHQVRRFSAERIFAMQRIRSA
jgi:predicted DNA-binding transcriptional regulator YafY